ncbi:MAG: hypothetical protein QXX67_06495 [Metallosphaera sp.]
MTLRGTRTAVLVEGFICVFQGRYLEHLFWEKDQFYRSEVKKEINFSNFGLGKQYSGDLIEECFRIVNLISKKLKKME